MHAYVQAFMEQVLVSVACNGAHSLKQRLGRWLLMMDDRTDDNLLRITHTLLAEMLGVHSPYHYQCRARVRKGRPNCTRPTTDCRA
jgi:hypothetical protein